MAFQANLDRGTTRDRDPAEIFSKLLSFGDRRLAAVRSKCSTSTEQGCKVDIFWNTISHSKLWLLRLLWLSRYVWNLELGNQLPWLDLLARLPQKSDQASPRRRRDRRAFNSTGFTSSTTIHDNLTIPTAGKAPRQPSITKNVDIDTHCIYLQATQPPKNPKSAKKGRCSKHQDITRNASNYWTNGSQSVKQQDLRVFILSSTVFLESVCLNPLAKSIPCHWTWARSTPEFQGAECCSFASWKPQSWKYQSRKERVEYGGNMVEYGRIW